MYRRSLIQMFHPKLKAKDEIYITEKLLVISRYQGKNSVINIRDIKEYKSLSSLTILLKSDQRIVLKYGEWKMPVSRIRELVKVLSSLLNSSNQSE